MFHSTNAELRRGDTMIRCEGLRENNLKNICVSFPQNEITSVIGVSGSGKSSFAFDCVYAESHRTFFELMFPQTSELRIKLLHPDLDRISPVLPAISMKQTKNNFNPRSTVGTYSGISNILRTFFSSVLRKISGHSISSSMLSPNTSAGACPQCKGLGFVASINLDEVIDQQCSIDSGGIKFWRHKSNPEYYKQILNAVCCKLGIDSTIPISQIGDEKTKQILASPNEIIVTISYRTSKGGKRTKKVRFLGVLHELESYAKKHSTSEILVGGYRNYFIKSTCPSCNGKRVRNETEQWKLCGLDFASIELLSINRLKLWLGTIQNEYVLSPPLLNALKVLTSKIESLEACELGHLCLARSIPTLSGGEYQRLRLSLALSANISNMLFIFDEPSAGLHPKNVEHMFSLMQELKNHGNTVLLVEHNPTIIKKSDYIIEIGPSAGGKGGQITFAGSSEQFFLESTPCSHQLFSNYNPEYAYNSQSSLRPDWIELTTLSKNNVQIEQLSIPLKKLVAIIGVSGSGKSSLLQAISERFEANGKGKKVCILNQKAIGKNIRSTVATYLGIFDDIRQLFAAENPNVSAQSFSYNSKIGQCPCCKGTGIQTYDLDFLPEEDAICPECGGTRYSKSINNYTFHGVSISQVLNMSVDSALLFFSDISCITQKLIPLQKIGLGYIHIGQSANSLSGGESQRVKLGKALQNASHTGMYYLLDEPTIGLHSQDVTQLLNVFKEMTLQGATILVAEHTIQLIRNADYIIELGVGGGEMGGKVIAAGSPSQIANTPQSMIAEFL